MNILYVALGGAIGAVLRYLVAAIVSEMTKDSYFPWGTLTVNMVGCLIIGSLWSWSETHVMSPMIRSMVVVGAIGSFTTFSTYGMETLRLMFQEKYLHAFLNLFVSNFLGICCVFLGFITTKNFMR